jgi:hypothetical protein
MAKTTSDVWARRVRRWRASGLTATEFASREGYRPATLRWWSWRLGRDEHRPTFVDATAMLVPTTPATNALEIVIRESVRIRVSAGFDATLLRDVVAALEQR